MASTKASGATSASISAALPGLVNSIGEREFGGRLLDCLNALCGAEYCTVLNFGADAPTTIATEHLHGVRDLAAQQLAIYFAKDRWRRDPMIALAREKLETGSAGPIHMPISALPIDFTEQLYKPADICDRMVLCGDGPSGMVSVILLRTARCGNFSHGDELTLNGIGDLIMSMIRKHVDVSLRTSNLLLAFTSLETIERNLAGKRTSLSRREVEVCARILYGMSTIGIALELGIGEETVMTYRKRAYQRLNVSTQRDLYLWYLSRWNSACIAPQSMN